MVWMVRMCLCVVLVCLVVLPVRAAGAEGAEGGFSAPAPADAAAPVVLDEGIPLAAEPLASRVPGRTLEELFELAEVPAEAVSVEEPPVPARADARRFVFGERVPRMACLPYRACTIRLGADERVLHLAIGDSERWLIEEVSAPGTRPVLVFKPLRYNLLTNLVVRTDRRLYVVELASPKPPQGGESGDEDEAAYDALVEFSYPGDWSRRVAEGAPGGPWTPGVEATTAVAPAADPSRLHFAYRFDRPLWRPHRLGWTPDVVYDDGERTFIHLPPAARHRDLPAVVAVGEDGSPEPVDASVGVGGEWLVVPVVAEALRLVVGSEDRMRRLTIERVGGLR